MSRTTRGATALSTVVALAGLLAFAVGVWWWSSDAPPGGGPAVVAGPGEAPTAGLPEPVLADPVPGAPHRLVIPALDVAAPVVAVLPRGDTLVPPQDAARLGWWAEGAKPGAGHGSALITGHTVHSGGGALDDLETLRRGQRIQVRTDRGAVTYRVTRTEVFTKGQLSRRAPRLFDQEVPGRLVLVTCEEWDGTRYLSNVVVTARPV